MRDELRFRVRTYFSIQHLQSAAHFAREARKIEDAYGIATGRASEITLPIRAEHAAAVTASIFSAAAFLEATINELFADAAENQLGYAWPNQEIPALLGGMWRVGAPRTASYTIFEKYQVCLTLARKTPFAEGTLPAQDIILLTRLRNALIHYEPEDTVIVVCDTGSETEKGHRLDKQLSPKFPRNSLAGASAAFFPDQCLGYGCAKWAVESSIKFADEFFHRMSMKSMYGDISDSISLL